MPLNPNDPHDLRLVIVDVADNSPNKGEFFCVDGNNASGVPIPAFRTGFSLPPAGNLVGEGFFVTTSQRGYVWDGANWQDVTPSPIKSYATDADLLVATDPVGIYANTQDTGNLYIRLASGWKQVNVRHYANQAAMEADTPATGTQAELLSDGSLWEFRNPPAVAPVKPAAGTSVGWPGGATEPVLGATDIGLWIDITAATNYQGTFPYRATGTVHIPINMSDGTTADLTIGTGNYLDASELELGITAPAPATGAACITIGGRLWMRLDTPQASAVWPVAPPTPHWICSTVREFPDLAGVQGWTTSTNSGDQALALDTDVRYIRTAGGWKPVSTYEDTEANIRAATWPLNGQQAQATDTGNFFIRRAGQWVEDPIQHYATDAALQAATPPDGTLAWADDTGNVYARVGTTWKGINTGFSDPIPIGTISAFPTTAVPAGWLKCDGSAVPADSKYDELRTLLGTGNNIPDLQGEFLRGVKAGDTPLTHVDWTTGRPKTAFTTNDVGVHHHQAAQQQKTVGWTSGSPFKVMTNSTNDPENSNAGAANTDDQGSHTHQITGGGDAETAPDHTLVVWCIKAHHNTIAPSAYQMDYQPDNTTLAADDVLKYDAVNNKWINTPSTGFGLQAVELTQTAYDAIATKDPNTLYLITGP